MKHHLLITAAAVAVAAGAMVAFPSISATQAPPMGGGYTNVIPIPVEDAEVEAIAGALFKPTGAGPFPAVIYLPGCDGIGTELGSPLERSLLSHLPSRGIATLIVDPYSARGEKQGACDSPSFDRTAKDANAAMDVLAAMPDIDAKRVFLMGFDVGASSALLAVGSARVIPHRGEYAGVIAYYPLCGATEFGQIRVPAIIMFGDEDDVAMTTICQGMRGKANVEVVVYPGAAHGFAIPGVNGDYFGHIVKYDDGAAKDAQARADAFIATHIK